MTKNIKTGFRDIVIRMKLLSTLLAPIIPILIISCCLQASTALDSVCTGECEACNLYHSYAPIFVHAQRTDGVGATLQQIIYAMAFAESRGWNYGGVTGPFDRRPHGFSTSKAALAIFGTSSVFLDDRVPQRAQGIVPISIRDFQTFGTDPSSEVSARYASQITDGVVIQLERYMSIPLDEMILDAANLSGTLPTPEVCPDCNCTYSFILQKEQQTTGLSMWFKCGVTLSKVFSDRFLEVLRRGAACNMLPPRYFKVPEEAARRGARAPAVAMHIRRGDVGPRSGGMYTPNQFYLDIAGVIRGMYPDADIHAFTYSRDAGEFADIDAAGIAVHLAGDPLEDWAHFAQADVFVMARSTFSHVPALLNDKCVVYQHHWRAPLASWLDVEGLDVSLPACLGRVWEREGAPKKYRRVADFGSATHKSPRSELKN